MKMEKAPDISLINERLSSISDGLRRIEQSVGPAADLAMLIEREQRRRRKRRRVFRSAPFADPAWDILLELGRGRLTGQRISVTDASLVSNAPFSTGMRYLSRLVDEGLVDRMADDSDGRRVFVRITDIGLALLAECFGDNL